MKFSGKCKLKLEFKLSVKSFQKNKKWKAAKGVYKHYVRYKKDKTVIVLIMNEELLDKPDLLMLKTIFLEKLGKI